MFYQPIVKNALMLGKLSSTDFAVLVVILSYMNVSGEAFPSTTTMSTLIGITPRTIERSVKVLVEVGLIVRYPRKRHSTLYKLGELPTTWLRQAEAKRHR